MTSLDSEIIVKQEIYYFVLLRVYLKTERKYYNFGTKSSRRAWHVVPAQKVEEKVEQHVKK